jgi:polysaccharide biosynthesis transport protein
MDVRNNDFPPESTYAYASSADPRSSIGDILATLRREWRLLVIGCLIGLTLGVFYSVFQSTLYKSSARILLDRSVTRYLHANKIGDDPTFDETEIASQVYILSSESIAVPVVRSMNLAHDSEFVSSLKANGGNVNKVTKLVKQFIGWNDHTDPIVDPDAVLEETAVETFLKRLTVNREEIASVITVTFASEDPKKAARIANTVAETYIETSLETKLKSTKLVSQWLQDRMMELKAQVTEADRALQDYKTGNNLVNGVNGSLNTEQLTNVSVQLANARLAVSEAKSRLEDFHQMAAGEGIIGAAATEGLTKLRSEYREITARATELESLVGPKHKSVVKIHEKMDELRKSIRDEEQRIADSEYKTAMARESALDATAAQLVEQAGTSNRALIEMRELQSSADTLRNLYNTFLQKLREIDITQTEIPVQNARVLTSAVPSYKSSKKVAVVLAGSIMVGLFLGAGTAVAREWAADVFRTPRAVEEVTGIHCVVLPMVKANPRRIEEFVLDAPYSRFTEALRGVKALINTAALDGGVKVIGVVSSVAKEGKTTVAANLAALMVASSCTRVLVIDGDVHLRLLSARLAPDAREGLIEALADPSRLGTLVYQRQSGLDILPCILSTRLPNAADLLGSRKMEQLLVAARKAYDYIIIEIAPIMSVTDMKMIERFIDRFIYVVEWGHTKQRLVLETLSEAQIIRERLLGILLNKVDPFALRSLEAYKGGRFRDYYQE